MTNSLESIAKKIQYLVEVEKHDFVKRVVGEIKAETLDSHFLIRSTEQLFSYDWHEWLDEIKTTGSKSLMDEFNKSGCKSLKGRTDLMDRVRQENTERTKRKEKKLNFHIFHWCILADAGFTEPRHFAEVLQQYAPSNGNNSPVGQPESWALLETRHLEAFLEDLKQGKAGTEGKNLEQAFQRTRAEKSTLGLLNRKLFYRTLMNCHVLVEKHDGSYAKFLTDELSHILGKAATWADVWKSRPEDWEKTKPWDKLSGIGDNIFFYILRDIDFGKDRGSSRHGYIKFDSRTEAFFDHNDLWSLEDTLRGKNNERASLILETINAEIKRKDPQWPYTISHLNAAIYEPDLEKPVEKLDRMSRFVWGPGDIEIIKPGGQQPERES